MKNTKTVYMCEICKTNRSIMIVISGDERERRCESCHVDVIEAEAGGISFRRWYWKVYKETFTEDHAVLDVFIDQYKAYCSKRGFEPYWDVPLSEDQKEQAAS